MAKKNKAAQIAEMLKAGESVRYIKRMLGVSEGYIYQIKKLMNINVEVGGEAAPLELTEEMKELAYQVTRGRQAAEADNVDAILDERGERYGDFFGHAAITQHLKSAAHQFAAERGKQFGVDQAEALDMIFHKIGRILNGDPNYADSWIDIAGYAKLVADRLEGRTR